jgi:hypothetical protein
MRELRLNPIKHEIVLEATVVEKLVGIVELNTNIKNGTYISGKDAEEIGKWFSDLSKNLKKESKKLQETRSK